MAYKLRYFKEFTHADGKVIRLEIHKKDSTAGALMIGDVVQGLSLQIQGQQGDIDSPIVKTSLSMTFVDAQDIADGRKNGFWEEFYTPDSVLWKVLVKAKDSQDAEFRTIWGGYVTPDSFTEDLVYRGSVNIIARDNIGHMQDFPFDAEGDADGMISLYSLVSSAWAKIDSPMSLDWRGEEDSILWMNTSEWIPAYDTLMNVSAFEDMNWYQALEKALYSYGVVMRYAGNNRVVVCPLRSMPDYGREAGNIGHLVPQFIAGATRELVPAVKRIEESVEYDMVESLPMPHLKAQDFDGSTNSYRCKIEGVDMGYGSFGTAEHDAPAWPIINGDKGWSNIPSSTLYFSPYAYELGYFSQRRELGEELLRYTYIAANNVDNRLVTFKKSITCSDFTIRMRFGQPWGLNRQGQLEQQSVFNLWRIYYAIMIDQNGVQEYYDTDRGWRPTYRELSVVYDPKQENFDFEAFVAIGEHTGKADIHFIISKIEYAQTSLASIHQTGLYAQVQELSFNSPESASLLEKNTVNTNYKAENNVVISRDPEFGPAYNSVALPGFIKNGIFYREGGVIVPAKKWAFGRAGDQQMAVYNHLQLLAYYAKPNNLISGTIVNGDVTRVACIYDWHGAEHMLISGTYNLLNGHIESAVLREFARYEDMWSDVAGADMPDTEQESRSNMEGGGASGGGASSTYTNTTDVNVGGGGGGTGASYLNDLLDVNTDGVVAQSVLYFNGTSWVDMSLATLLNPYVKAEAFNPVKAWFDKLGTLIVVEDGNVVVKTNLVIEGDMASAGVGENPGGGGSVIGGIMVNGMPYTDDDGDGFITLPDYPKKLSALENDLNLGSFAYKNALAVSDIPDLSGKYLPLSGGTIESENYDAFKIKRTTDAGAYVTFENKNGRLGSIGFEQSTNKPILYRGATTSQIDYILHSGNVGDYALKYQGISLPDNIKSGFGYNSEPIGYPHTGGFATFGNGTYGFQIMGYALGVSKLSARALNNGSWEPWKTIAFTDSNVASATKLATPRTIWGQSFDGTGNVSGSVKHTNGWSFIDPSDGYVIFGYDYAHNNKPIYIDGKEIYLRYGTAHATGLILNSSGNVTIGSSDLATTNYKLYVSGKTRINSIEHHQHAIVFNLDADNYSIGTNGTSLMTYNMFGGHKFCTSGGTARMLIKNTGNVGIGTADPQAKLDVAGVIRANIDAANEINVLVKNSLNTVQLGVTAAGVAYLYCTGAYDLGFSTNSTRRMTITSDGNVLIGTTTNSGYKLDVAGTGRFTGKTTHSGGIDIPNGQQLAFLDASGNRHTIAWDSASNGILIDGNLIVLGELATGLPLQEVPSIPEVGV